jgi:hypothetical protein
VAACHDRARRFVSRYTATAAVAKSIEIKSALTLCAQTRNENAVATMKPAITACPRPSTSAAQRPVSHTTPAAASALGRRASVSSMTPIGVASSAISQYESSGLSP